MPAKAPAPAARVDAPAAPASSQEGPEAREGQRRAAHRHLEDRSHVAAEGSGTADGEFLVGISLKKTSPTPEEAELVRSLDSRAARLGDERTRIRSLLLAHRRTRIQAVQEPVREFIESIGGTVLWEGRAVFGLDASLTRTMILQVAELPEVERLDADQPFVESAHPE